MALPSGEKVWAAFLWQHNLGQHFRDENSAIPDPRFRDNYTLLTNDYDDLPYWLMTMTLLNNTIERGESMWDCISERSPDSSAVSYQCLLQLCLEAGLTPLKLIYPGAHSLPETRKCSMWPTMSNMTEGSASMRMDVCLPWCPRNLFQKLN